MAPRKNTMDLEKCQRTVHKLGSQWLLERANFKVEASGK